ncbi:L-sorbose 1-phosphate reductase [Alkalispirochaeta sphaeroplastigenens]|uniref:L-sorbose 1-phosphate reductase n=1 Tax=Alkalispirochaeta sphaeroplastigenens TaxID=1187066 RepID=A0A2S4JGP5_9SPIO|nr:zinc-binding dehydrogenase [Alkalispirochaeta sphaeroplastigenens]POQ98734.1 L-sorbose 1-phosphate reductase [Alkalispirochaeta sphaeroplastigenens]
MKTKAVRMYGKEDLRLEEFELPPLKPGEILAQVVSDSLCMSSYKAAIQGSSHKRVPADIDRHPVMLGHELCGEILQVGDRWKDRFSPGQRFSIQPALNYRGTLDAPGYSYPYIGGDATRVIIPEEVMEMDCLLEYQGDAFFLGSLAEPISCVAGAFHANYHTRQGSYEHSMGIVEGGKTAILAGVGPMGLAAIDYAIHNPRKPGLLVVTDIDQERLDRASRVYTVEEARRQGVELHYINTSRQGSEQELLDLTGGAGYDDVFVFAPVRPVLEQGDRLLGHDGCLNFFAGPSSPDFRAELNFYEVHYSAHHLVGTSGGNTDDMREALDLMGRGLVNPAGMITHVGGLNAVIETTLNLPAIPGGKKLIYTHKNLPLVAIDDFAARGATDPFYAALAEICGKNNNIWSAEAEAYLLREAPEI